MQMLCASGDTTLLLTRHVRERGDFTLEYAIHELTDRQAEVFGFAGRGVVAEGNVADLAVFALDELHYDNDEFVHDPTNAVEMSRGYPSASAMRASSLTLRSRSGVCGPTTWGSSSSRSMSITRS